MNHCSVAHIYIYIIYMSISHMIYRRGRIARSVDFIWSVVTFVILSDNVPLDLPFHWCNCCLVLLAVFFVILKRYNFIVMCILYYVCALLCAYEQILLFVKHKVRGYIEFKLERLYSILYTLKLTIEKCIVLSQSFRWSAKIISMFYSTHAHN